MKENPHDYGSEYNYGFVLMRLGRFAEAKQHLEEARQLRPDSEEVLFQLANVLRRLNQNDQAQQELAKFKERKTQQRQEDIAGTTANRANQALQEGDPKSAIQGYRDALKLDPNNAKTYYNIALAQAKLGDKTGVIASLEKSIALDPSFSQARNQLGLSYLAAGRTQDARASSKRRLPVILSAPNARTTSACCTARWAIPPAPKSFFAKLWKIAPGIRRRE